MLIYIIINLYIFGKEQLKYLYDEIFPIGIIIHSTTLNTSAKVKAIYRGNTWSQITTKFLFGTGTIDTYDDSGNKYTTNITAKSSGGSTSSTLTTYTLPSHTHPIPVNVAFHPAGGGAYSNSWAIDSSATGVVDAKWQGGSKPHNNMPPYYGVYIWERTA